MLENVKKGWITTLFGVLFLLAVLTLIIFPMFRPEFNADSIVLSIGAAIGVGLLLSPDDLFKKLKEKL